jgi:hypothetical protein
MARKSLDPAVEDAIRRAAAESGIDPAAAMAIAERESSFNPTARSSKTIRGLYQMRGDHRARYGVGDSDDPYEQSKGWGKFFQTVKKEMAGTLGRDPTDSEGYLGHHFGGVRAARMMKMDPNTPVDQVFTPTEMAQNPHFGRAGTVGVLNSSILADMDKRTAKFGGGAAPAGAEIDFSQFGAPVDQTAGPRIRVAGDGPVDTGPDYQGAFERNKKWSKPGTYRTDLADQEPAFQKWVQDNKVPFDVNRTGPDDYDMRGFWKGAQDGDKRAVTTPNPNDGKIHYDDKWKTPYHKSFSSESQWAQPNAPTWNDKDQLIDPSNGGVVFDEKAPDFSHLGIPAGNSQSAPAASSAPDFSNFGVPA